MEPGVPASRPLLPQDGIILRNLKRASYKLSVLPLEGRVVAMTSEGSHVFVSVAGRGILVFREEDGQSVFCHQITGSDTTCTVTQLSQVHDVGVTCHELSVSAKWLVYIREASGALSLCVHPLAAVLRSDSVPVSSLEVTRRAPLVVDAALGLLAIGCGAWSVSWTSGPDDADNKEMCVRTLSLPALTTVREWPAADHSVSLLRRQTTGGQTADGQTVTSTHMLGVADSRAGLRVYDLAAQTPAAYTLLYSVPVDEIRNFHLAGSFVAVFHRFEANVTFWNMSAQKTILVIDLQDQLRELAAEWAAPGEDEDAGVGGELWDADHVTTVTSIATAASAAHDLVLLYGTRSGCVFGLSVTRRHQLFSVPCPHEEEAPGEGGARPAVLGLRYLPRGKLAVCYYSHGLSTLDFDLDNPPDRPPTRGQKRV